MDENKNELSVQPKSNMLNLFFNLDQLKPVPFRTLFSPVCAYCTNIMDTNKICLLVAVTFISAGIPVPLTENTKTF